MKNTLVVLKPLESRASLEAVVEDLKVEDPAAEAAHTLLKEAFDDRTRRAKRVDDPKAP